MKPKRNRRRTGKDGAHSWIESPEHHWQKGGTYYLSSYLFATPTWKEGAGRLLDFGDALTEYNGLPSPDEADLFAMWLDWRAVGEDLETSMKLHARELNDARFERAPMMVKQRWSLVVENVEALRQSFELRSPGLWSRTSERSERSQRGSTQTEAD